MEAVCEQRQHLRDLEGFLLLGSQFPRWIVEMEICCFQPHLISNFPRGKVLSVSFFHDP